MLQHQFYAKTLLLTEILESRTFARGDGDKSAFFADKLIYSAGNVIFVLWNKHLHWGIKRICFLLRAFVIPYWMITELL